MDFQRLTGGILRVGDLTQAQARHIFLAAVFRKFHSTGGLSYKDGQDAGGHGIQGAALTHPLLQFRMPERTGAP